MLKKTTLALVAASLATAHAGTTSSVTSPAPSSGQPDLPKLDVSLLRYNYSGDMDLEDEDGSLSVSRVQLFTLLSKPIAPIEGLTISPYFDYKLTALDFDDVGSNFPIRDEGLHSINVGTYLLSMRDDTPWVWGGFAQAKMNTDFQHVDGDDFTFDFAAGVGYRFSRSFVIGVGGSVTNLNGNARFYPGINFDWIISDQLRVGAYGATFLATYTINQDWLLNLQGESGGGIWNITDEGGRSHSIDLSSYNLSLVASRRLVQELWLNAGVGFTFGNEIRLTRTSGDKLYTEDLESGLFATLGVSLKAW